MSQLLYPGWRNRSHPESMPTLPFAAGAKQEVLTKAIMAPPPSNGLHVKAKRGGVSSLPVTWRLSWAPLMVDPPEATLYAALVLLLPVVWTGGPLEMAVRPENCHPFSAPRPTGLFRNVPLRARSGKLYR